MIKKIVGGAVALGAVGLWKFVIGPAVAISATNSLGAGWNDAKPEFVAEFTKVFQTEFASFELSPAEIQTLSTCVADKSVAFLNTTDCSYQYNTATTSEAEHLAKQEECMTRVKYEDQEEKFSVECFKEALPDDWKLMRKNLSDGFAQAVQAEGTAPAAAKTAGDCFADGAIAMAKEKKCPLINKEAKDAENIFFELDACLSGEEGDKAVEALGAKCMGVEAN